MLLKQAVCKNFRLLHDVTFDFDADTSETGGYGFTVIRGENSFGKTTTLNALRWAFFGSEVLGLDYKLFPQFNKADSAMVSVEITFCIQESFTNKNKQRDFGWVDYKLKRSVTEKRTSSQTADRGTDSLLLQRKERSRWVDVENNQAWLASKIPSTVDQLFFIDGDNALDFVQASRERRRDLVKRAATDLLETDLIEDAIERIEKSKLSVLRAVKKSEASEKQFADSENTKIEITQALRTHEEALLEATSEVEEWEEKYIKREALWTAEIAKGDREDLQKQLNTIKTGKDSFLATMDDIEDELSTLLIGDLLSRSLVYKSLKKGATQLDDEQVEGRLPASVVSALKELLASGNQCFCGTSLAKGTDCRKHLEEEMIHQSGFELEEGNTTRLRDSANRWAEKNPGKEQKKTINLKLDRRGKAFEESKVFSDRQAELETRLETLAPSAVEDFRRDKEEASKKCVEASEKVRKIEGEIRTAKEKLREVDSQLKTLGSELDEKSEFNASIEAHDDLIELVKGALASVKSDQIAKLSTALDKNFRRMTGELGQDDVVVKSTEITEEFEIIVKSSQGVLNTENELSGAQKRALTYSFIHALINATGVTAPSVIDTPLGMTSGAVKKEITRQLIRNSKQLILFLTREEIKNIEKLITKEGGKQITITRIGSGAVKNKQKGSLPSICVCQCGIEKSCNVCELIDDFGDSIEDERDK